MAKLVKIVVSVIVFCFIVIVIAINTVDLNSYKPELTELVKNATGRDLQIKGDMSFGLSLVPSVVVEDVSFSNASWASSPKMISLKKLTVNVALYPLLKGELQLKKLILIKPEISLETNNKGMGNWVITQKKADTKPDEQNQSLGIKISEVEIKDAIIHYKKRLNAKQSELVIDNVNFRSNGLGDSISLLIKAVYNNVPITAEGTIGSLKKFTDNRSFPIDLKTEIGAGKLQIKGAILRPSDLTGIELGLKFELDTLAKLSKLAGASLPDTGPVSLAVEVSSDKKKYAFNDIEFKAGNTDLEGDISINMASKKPLIQGKLHSNWIELAELIADKKSNKKTAHTRLFSDDDLAFAVLKAFDANLLFSAKKITHPPYALSNTEFGLALKQGKLTLSPVSIMFPQGAVVEGHMSVDASKKRPLLATDINITGLELDQINKTASGGAAVINFKATGRGQSIQQLMAGLNGKLLIEVGQAVITDSLLAALHQDLIKKLLSTLKVKESHKKNIALKCAVVNLSIKNGIATSDKGIAISTNRLNLLSSGTVNLATETLDLGIKPVEKEGIGVSSATLVSLVRVTGTLSTPKVAADLSAKNSLTVGTAVATGGVSLLVQGLYDRATIDENPCDTARGIHQQTSVRKTAVDNVKKVGGSVSSTVKDAGSSVVDSIKGFFD